MSETNEFTAIFLDEAVDILTDWEAVCIQLKADINNIAFWDKLFRCAHNLKGSSKSVGFDDLGEFIHKVEDFITLLRQGSQERSSQAMQILLIAQERMVHWIEALRVSPAHKESTSDVLSEIDLLSKPASIAAKDAENSAGFVSFDESSPKTPKDIGTILVESGSISPNHLEKAVELQNRKLGQIIVAEGMATQKAVDEALAKQKSTQATPDETVRVSTKKLDALIRAAGESAIQYSIIQHQLRSIGEIPAGLTAAMDLGEKISKELHESSLSLRMQPLTPLFQRLERIASDVSAQLGKKIKINLVGQHTELDKSVVEAIKDPLIHIVRNAVDHGLEPSEQRLERGKDVVGSISIEAKQEADAVSLIIKDDGKGLDPQKLRKKAIEKGLIEVDAKLSDFECQNLIFLPGFSTAEKITDVSGRGVGMDVVRKSIDELSGKVVIESKLGEGTTFHITLPSSLSIVDALLIKAGDHEVVVPIQSVVEIVDLSEYPARDDKKGGHAYQIRGKVVASAPLSSFLDGILPSPRDVTKVPENVADFSPALVASFNATTVAFRVTEIVRKQTVVIRPLSQSMRHIPGLSGTTILPNGNPGVILDMRYCIENFIRQVNTYESAEVRNVG